MVRHVLSRFLLLVDHMQWRAQTRSLRRKRDCQQTKTVLFCDLLTMVATAKVEAIFAGALRLRGYRPMVLLHSKSRLVEMIFKAVRNVRFIYLSSYLTPDVLSLAENKAASLLSQRMTFDDLLKLEVDGYRVGKNVLSIVLRELRTGRLDVEDPDHLARVRQYLAESLAVIQIADRLLEDVDPDIMIVNERGYTPAGEIFDACVLKGIDVVQWVGAPGSDSLIYKRYNLENRANHQLALSNAAWQKLSTMPWDETYENRLMEQIRSHYDSGSWYNRQQLQQGKRIKSKEEVYAQLQLDPEKKTAVIFTHILYDATFFYGESLFSDYAEWLVETVRLAIVNDNINWIIKVHPANVWRARMDGVALEQLEYNLLSRELGTLPEHIRFMNADCDINTYSLFSSIDYGLTVRGTIGMELPCFGIPVVTAGTGRYSGRGFTVDPEDKEQYRQTVLNLHSVAALDKNTMEKARRYAYGIFFMRPMPMLSFILDFHANTYGHNNLKQNVFLKKDVTESLNVSNDLGYLADWMINSKSTDLMCWNEEFTAL